MAELELPHMLINDEVVVWDCGISSLPEYC